MPVAAFAFGSFGDILATAQLLIKVILVLKNGRHSSERDETERELKALWTDLANLTLIPVDEGIQSSPLALSVSTRIQEEVQRCHLTILRFFQKISASSGLIHKLLWAVSEEKELAAFRMRVIERRIALGVLVGMLNSGALLAVKDRVDQVAQGAAATKDRVDQVAEGTTQIRDVVQEGVSGLAQQLATYHQQIVAVIRHVPHGVSEETFVVISPAGVSIPIPVVYCGTYEDLSRIIGTYMADRYTPTAHYWIITLDGCTFDPDGFSEVVCAGTLLEMVPVQHLSLEFDRCVYCTGETRSRSTSCHVRINSKCLNFVQLCETRSPLGNAMRMRQAEPYFRHLAGLFEYADQLETVLKHAELYAQKLDPKYLVCLICVPILARA
ncbi:hypothetical protein DFH06DRAFT_289758 [Mycena polygramma]|nr:hypothetical protein DFH06DRAFT_289758 [Mycena polygramma]